MENARPFGLVDLFYLGKFELFGGPVIGEERLSRHLALAAVPCTACQSDIPSTSCSRLRVAKRHKRVHPML